MRLIEIAIIIFGLSVIGLLICGVYEVGVEIKNFCDEKGLQHNFAQDYCYEIEGDYLIKYKVEKTKEGYKILR
jgi:hypothetical protein